MMSPTGPLSPNMEATMTDDDVTQEKAAEVRSVRAWPVRPGPRALVALSRGYGVIVYGRFQGDPSTVYVSGVQVEAADPAPTYVLWRITDNGGELVVRPVNAVSDDPRGAYDVPYEDRTGTIDDGTLAYRIAMALRGDAIDYTYRCPELMEV